MRTTKINMKDFGARLRMLRLACGLYSVPHLFADVYVRIISDGVQLYFNNGRQ